MAQPVWVLSVDLQAKTATFQSGMAEAARAARGSFNDIKDGAGQMAGSTSGSMMEARHGVMLLGEEFGVHLPRGLTMFISSLGPVAAAMSAAFPFLALTVGATLLLEHLAKTKEAGEKVAAEWGHIETEATKALSKTADALLEVEMQSDRLSGNYLTALQKQLTLIDHQSMSELESAFDGLATKMDTVLSAAKRGTLMSTLLGSGASEKVQTEFDKFKDQYDSLLSQGKDTEARGALVDEIIQAQEQLKKYQSMPQTNSWVREAVDDYGHLITQLENVNRLQDMQSQIAAGRKKNATTEAQDAHPDTFNPELFVDAENKKHVSLAETIALIKKQQEAANAADKLQLEGMEGLAKGLKEIGDERRKLAQEAGKEDAGHGSKMAELQLAADKEAGQMKMALGRVSAEQQLSMELDFATREYNGKRDGLNRELNALDTFASDYQNKKAALNNRLLELDKQFQNQTQLLEDQAQKKQLASVQGAERQMEQLYASGFTQVIMGKKSFAQMMAGIDTQIVESALQHALMSLAQDKGVSEMKRLDDARTAAANAYKWAGGNPILGSAAGALAFASVMAFEEGGIVPGVGRGDIVPAMLEPGEVVLTKRVTENLQHAARFGDDNRSGGDVHVHHHATYHVQAFNADGVQQVLRDHGNAFVKHAENHLRKLNR